MSTPLGGLRKSPYFLRAFIPSTIPQARRSFSITGPVLRRQSRGYREQAIVSSFIFEPTPTAQDYKKLPRFALFKRSDSASTYPSKWAVCSGSIEPTDSNPEAAARREIKEETQLGNDDITLLKQGNPFVISDHDLQTHWRIYAFSFEMKERREIKLGHEHTEYTFVRPDELGSFDCADKLEYGMRKVLGHGFQFENGNIQFGDMGEGR